MDFDIYVSNVFVLITTMGLFFIQNIEKSLAGIPSDAATKSVSNELMQWNMELWLPTIINDYLMLRP